MFFFQYHDHEKHFTCEICGKGFRYESERNRHFAAHDGIKKFLCQMCGASYTTKQRFVLHLKDKHPDVPPESVVTIAWRKGEGRLRDRLRKDRPDHQKRKRGPNRNKILPSVVSTNESRRPELNNHHDKSTQPISQPSTLSVPIPISNPAPIIPSYAEPHPQLQQNYSHYTGVPPRHIMPDPRDFWQWQTPVQPQTYPQVHNNFLYQYQPVQAPTVEATET